MHLFVLRLGHNPEGQAVGAHGMPVATYKRVSHSGRRNFSLMLNEVPTDYASG